MKAENRNQMVRGVVAVGNRNSVVLSTNPADAEAHGFIIAYTHWYRHDDDLETLDKELKSLCESYASMRKTDSIMYGYEYKDYTN